MAKDTLNRLHFRMPSCDGAELRSPRVEVHVKESSVQVSFDIERWMSEVRKAQDGDNDEVQLMPNPPPLAITQPTPKLRRHAEADWNSWS